MCGFVGFLALGTESAPTEAWIETLIDTIAHRGPDDHGILVDGRAALGFRRLSILDLSQAGHQPMTSRDGTLSMVFNGEIYNYVELRAELEALGHRFVSSGDTEVLLASYAQWGRRCVDRLVGMYAFCIIDRRTSTMFVARDRLGIKPLYVVSHPRGVLFASELKAIRRSGLWGGGLNTARFAQFLSFGRTEEVPDDADTYLDGVQQILPGHSYTLRFDGTRTDERYWSPPHHEEDAGPDVVPRFLALFDDAMKLHMRSDVPVGVMLSGGMDSVSIACTMAQLAGTAGTGQALHAFCYTSEDFDESRQLEDTIGQIGATMHRVATVDADSFWTRLREAMWYHDEPVHSPSVLMGFELYRLAAANGIRVVLSGQGADETIGGYHYLFDHMLVTEALRGRLPTLLAQAKVVAESRGQSEREVLMRSARLVRAHLMSSIASYRSVAAGRRLLEGRGRAFLAPEFRALAAPASELPPGQTLSVALERAIRQTPLPHYLRVEDRNSMAHSVESRVPFLDHRLAEHALRLPARWKMSDGWNKRVLREAMAGRIPDSVRLRRQKFGFPTSSKRWFAGPLADGIRDIVRGGAVMRTGWFDQVAVERELERHVRGETDASNLLFNVAQLDSWLEWHEAGWEQPAQSLTRSSA
ncbi:MAG: asparagine synthase (glutamine-hydrolyzing) [Gemmatimonadaceae bacterium]